jgi:ssRNA-specific RNase YbeY (16S rRNA maturation enzyme)
MISVLQRASVRGQVWPSTLRRRAARLLEALGEEAADLVIVLSDDAEVHALNREWRHKDAPTDVLSFPQREGVMPPLPEGEVWPLGDVVISLETAARQASEDGCLPRLWPALGVDTAPEWALLDEVTFLLLHGVLHLCGFDHLEPEETAEMEAREAALLPALLGARRRPKPT